MNPRLFFLLPFFLCADLSAEGLSLNASVAAGAREVTGASVARPLSPGQWEASLGERREQWLEMLGLSPLPERTPLEATVTGVLDRGDYVVEKIHFQSMPGAHVAGNLYRPAKVTGKLPAVLYLCGHSKGKVNEPYQANPRWFGQHGYVALVLDPVQLGESQGMHHGTYREDRWDWPSRGYTPAGTEVWNAMRALDYLESRSDVDGEKMGVTGLSGGGAMSWFLGAADERVKVVVPVCQSGSIERMAVDRATDGHCDCAFWINYYRWCWPDIGSLIAPRAFMIASGSEDVLWRPAGYREVAHRIRHQYAALGVPDQFSLVEDLSPHGYTPKLRQAIFTFFNTHLKGDPTPVTDDVTDFVEPEENLLVFGGRLP
jgi:dienelactone hydrolase